MTCFANWQAGSLSAVERAFAHHGLAQLAGRSHGAGGWGQHMLELAAAEVAAAIPMHDHCWQWAPTEPRQVQRMRD